MEKSAVLSFTLVLLPSSSMSQTGIFLREEVNGLGDLSPLNFPNIERQTRYSILTEGPEHHLKAKSHASASGLLLEKGFNAHEYPRMRWRWKAAMNRCEVFEPENEMEKPRHWHPSRRLHAQATT